VAQAVMVLWLEEAAYPEVGVFGEPAAITSVEFPALKLTVEQVFATES
jgi:hypothetical protein